MRNLAPDIFRQRLLIEGYYAGEVTRERITSYLLDMAAALSLRTYADPIVILPRPRDGARGERWLRRLRAAD